MREPLPTVPQRTGGVMTRLAVARLRHAGLDPGSVLRQAGLSLDQVDDPKARLDVVGQVALLDIAAKKLDDPLLGFHLAKSAELRQLGLLYFVLASSATFRGALVAAERYSTVVNEGIVLRRLPGSVTGISYEYIGVPRYADRHQIEVFATVLVRFAREGTGIPLSPIRVDFVHARGAGSDNLDVFFGCPITFGAERDILLFSTETAELPLVRADPHLHDLLVGYAESALAHLARPLNTLRTRVENAATPLLPHGNARAGEVARQLGLSQRTLARRLAADGLTFLGVIKELRVNLAQRYLQDPALSVSEIAWLLGFQEVSAFTHAFKRWTGSTPSKARSCQ
jgi:AraC-like DNA-binding protein